MSFQDPENEDHHVGTRDLTLWRTPVGRLLVRGVRGVAQWIGPRWTLLLLLAVGIPLVALVSTALTTAVGLPPVPGNWTLRHFDAVMTVPNGEALGRSLLLALAAATILLVLGGLVAALERSRFGRTTGTLVTLTFVLPGSTLAVGLLITYGRWLGDTLLIILLAYLAGLDDGRSGGDGDGPPLPTAARSTARTGCSCR